MMNNARIWALSTSVAIVVAFSVNIAYAAWSGPPPGTTPPTNNVDAPVNVSATNQTKAGPSLLNVDKFWATGISSDTGYCIAPFSCLPTWPWVFAADTKSIYYNGGGSVGIGTTNPTSVFHIFMPNIPIGANGNGITLQGSADSTTNPGTSVSPGIIFRKYDGTLTGFVGGTMATAAFCDTCKIGDVSIRSDTGSVHIATHLVGNNALSRLIVTDEGDVGIGTSVPVATLDVKGFVHLAPQSVQPVACNNAAQKGSIAITSGSRICVCDGSSWKFDYNGSACSW